MKKVASPLSRAAFFVLFVFRARRWRLYFSRLARRVKSEHFERKRNDFMSYARGVRRSAIGTAAKTQRIRECWISWRQNVKRRVSHWHLFSCLSRTRRLYPSCVVFIFRLLFSSSFTGGISLVRAERVAHSAEKIPIQVYLSKREKFHFSIKSTASEKRNEIRRFLRVSQQK